MIDPGSNIDFFVYSQEFNLSFDHPLLVKPWLAFTTAVIYASSLAQFVSRFGVQSCSHAPTSASLCYACEAFLRSVLTQMTS